MTLNFDQFGTKIFFIFFRGAWDRVGVPRINSAHFELFWIFLDRLDEIYFLTVAGLFYFFVLIETYLQGGSGAASPPNRGPKSAKFSGGIFTKKT